MPYHFSLIRVALENPFSVRIAPLVFTLLPPTSQFLVFSTSGDLLLNVENTVRDLHRWIYRLIHKCNHIHEQADRQTDSIGTSHEESQIHIAHQRNMPCKQRPGRERQRQWKYFSDPDQDGDAA